jgi:hypothetical protein
MTPIFSHCSALGVSGELTHRPRKVWSRRDYYELLNLRRIIKFQCTHQPVMNGAKQEVITRDKN